MTVTIDGTTGINTPGITGLTTPVSVSNGGTGQSSAFTQYGLTYANTTTSLATTTAGTSGQVLTSSATSAPTWTTATDANTASAIVKRDASGNFSAGTITASSLNVGGTGSSQINEVGYNGYGGVGYHGFLTVTNTYGSATNPNKYFRINSTGGIEIVNSAYNAVIFGLSDGGGVTAGTFNGFAPSQTNGVASRIVVADGSGYINNNYFNSTDDVNNGSISYVMAKFGDNYYRSAPAARVAAFISGQSMNISGSATSLSTASGSAPSYSARAWVNFVGSTGGIRASGNVTSVGRNSTGNYTVNFTTAMQDASYSALCVCGTSGNVSGTNPEFYGKVSNFNTGSVGAQLRSSTGGVNESDTVCVAVFR